jgi:carbamate kinase
MRLVIALGGNALLRRGEAMSFDNQRANIKRAVTGLAAVIRAGHDVVITHGNGPQVGLLALQAAAGPVEAATPLDILDAESEGMIGYLLAQALRSELPAGIPIATLLTQVLVDPADPAFKHPAKPIGPVYDAATACQLKQEKGWCLVPDGQGWRRAVASPLPLEILDIGVIAQLIDAKTTVICAGGGGVPVAWREGQLLGIEAVID